MVRILQSVNVMDRAGLETMLMNYYRNIDRSKIQFDFLTHRPENGAYENEILEMGGKIYHAPRLYPQNYIRYFKFMKGFYKEHPEYKIIHSHIDAMSYFPLLAAKRSGVPIRIGHSHSSKIEKDMKYPIKFMALKCLPMVTTDYFACGQVAGNFMWKRRKFVVVHNAIELEKFAYDETLRRRVRKDLGILDTTLVIGHVGRFIRVKNQLFLLDIFSEIVREKKESLLMLIGKGEDEDAIRKRVNELGLNEQVMILIDRKDVNELYQAFDMFVMPSLYEGLPVVGVEAQANGLPCIFSDRISKEVILTNNSEMLSLERGASEWAKRILNKNHTRNLDAIDELKSQGYDIKIEAKKLENFYLDRYRNV